MLLIIHSTSPENINITHLLHPLTNLHRLSHLSLFTPLSRLLSTLPPPLHSHPVSLQSLAVSHWRFPHTPRSALGRQQLNYKHTHVRTPTHNQIHIHPHKQPHTYLGTAWKSLWHCQSIAIWVMGLSQSYPQTLYSRPRTSTLRWQSQSLWFEGQNKERQR